MGNVEGFRRDKLGLLFSFLVFALALSRLTWATQRLKRKRKHRKNKTFHFLAGVVPFYTYVSSAYVCIYDYACVAHVN